MRVGIDARFLTHPQHGGYKTYTENLVEALAEIDSPHSFVVYTDRAAERRRWEGERISVRVVSGAFPLVGMPWREQVRLPLEARRDGIDLLHAPAQTAPLWPGRRLVVTLHDTFSLDSRRNPRRARAPHDLALAYYLATIGRAAGRRATQILTNSEMSKRALVHELGVEAARVHVTYLAPSPSYVPIDREHAAAEVSRRFGLRAPFVLHLASPDGRKNTGTLVAAMERLRPANAELVIAGCGGERHNGGRVHALGHVSPSDLLHLYNAAVLFVFPSLEEGFGLPMLEAMACGTPVLAADSSAVPEVAGGAAMLVRCSDAEELGVAIGRLLAEPSLQRELSERGRARAQQFSWRRCAEQTCAVYERALA